MKTDEVKVSTGKNCQLKRKNAKQKITGITVHLSLH
jgi:hypothetical protein